MAFGGAQATVCCVPLSLTELCDTEALGEVLLTPVFHSQGCCGAGQMGQLKWQKGAFLQPQMRDTASQAKRLLHTGQEEPFRASDLGLWVAVSMSMWASLCTCICFRVPRSIPLADVDTDHNAVGPNLMMLF